MRGRVVAAVLAPVLLVAGAGGYLWADASDLVPGWITASPEPIPPAPFLTAQPVDPSQPPGTAVAALADDAAPLPDAAALQALADALRANPATSRSTNVSVIDLVTGQALVDAGAADPQVPASTAKLLTAVAVVGALGPDFQLHTVARYDAARGEVALVAGGDLLLSAGAGTGGDNPRTDLTWGGDMPAYGYAGLGDLADQVAAALSARGVTSVKVVVDDSAFPGPAIPAAWPGYAVPNGYAAPVTGIAVDVAKKSEGEYAPRWADPSDNAADVFATRLTERGIAATRAGARDGAGGDEVGSVASAPLADVAAYMLHTSDNSVAEVMTRVLAIAQGRPATPAESMAAVTARLASQGVDVTGLVLYDGAGFSDRNQVAPVTLTTALRVASAAPATDQLLGWLAEAGLNGTLDDRFVATAGAGTVRAKTGSLTGVTTLTGLVITADGRPLLFAVMADGMPAGQDKPRAAIDAFVSSLAQCGCGG